MNGLSQLISQTAIYGLSSIVGRFLNYLLVPLYTYTFAAGEYGVVSEFYAFAGFFSVVMTYGLETGFFRFRQKQEFSEDQVYSSALWFIVVAGLLLSFLIIGLRDSIAGILLYPDHTDYLIYFSLILLIDAITALPFAKLRAENRAWKFASIKMLEILLTIGLNLFFLLALPIIESSFGLEISEVFGQDQVVYIFLANLLASGVKFLLLLPQMRLLRIGISFEVMFPLLKYSMPMIVVGFAGMVNEMLDRVLLKYLLPFDLKENLIQLGVYGACYKLSILMTLFVQAFRYAGEPFFFAYAGKKNAKESYAIVMRYFVITGIFIFLMVTVFIDFFKYFIGEEYRRGLGVVPILLWANLCLGVYINLSVWYKLTDRTILGAWVSIAGAVVTILLNIWWIPIWGYIGSAWATLVCYGIMVLMSWVLGQKYYPVNYPVARMILYCFLALVLYILNQYWNSMLEGFGWISGVLCLSIYVLIVLLFDVSLLIEKRHSRLRSAT